SVCQAVLEARARGLLQLFQRKDLLPRTLDYLAALGDLDAVRTALEDEANDRAAVVEAFLLACSFEHEALASLLLDRCIVLDPELGGRIDAGPGRAALLSYFLRERRTGLARESAVGPWKAYRMGQVLRTVHEGDVEA